MTDDRPSALVVGGGLIGRSVGYYLARRDFDVDLIEAGTAHSQTSRGSLGVLTHFNGGDNPLSQLYRDSHAGYGALSEEFQAAFGMDIGWRKLGGMDLIFSEADEVEAEDTLAHNRERGCPVERLTAGQVLELEPATAGSVRGALYFPGDHRVEPEQLSAALGAGMVRQGGRLHLSERLVSVREASARGVIAETCTARYAVDYVVLAAGAWTRDLAARFGATVPVRPIRGQHIRGPGGSGPQLVLRHGGHHVLPSGNQTVVGATVEEVGFDTGTTSEARNVFVTASERILRDPPGLCEQRAGLRPKPKGGRPLIGPMNEHPRVFVATGHYKNGVLMGPRTGQLVAHWMATGAPPQDMSYFAPER